jgi:peptide/nickel transport system ATP-binding protein/oligopeptide transport system ATP-binding protein
LLLKQLQQEMGLSYLFITHDLRVVRHIANEVLVMQKGKVIEQGSVENIYNAPQQIYTQQLLSAIPGQGLRVATA